MSFKPVVPLFPMESTVFPGSPPILRIFRSTIPTPPGRGPSEFHVGRGIRSSLWVVVAGPLGKSSHSVPLFISERFALRRDFVGKRPLVGDPLLASGAGFLPFYPGCLLLPSFW